MAKRGGKDYFGNAIARFENEIISFETKKEAEQEGIWKDGCTTTGDFSKRIGKIKKTKKDSFRKLY